MRSSLFLFLAMFSVVPLAAQAQGTPAAVDTSGTLFEINRPLRDELGLFPQYRFFQRALLFRRADSTYYFDVIFKAEEGPKVERVPESATELVSLRRMVSRAVGKMHADSLQEERSDARSRIAGEAAAMGSFVYGPLAINEIGISRPLVVIGTDVAVSSCLYAATVLLLPDDGSVTNGVASATIGGMVNGFVHGVMIDQLVSGESMLRAHSRSAIGFSLAEAGICYWLARNGGYGQGHSDLLRYGGFFGSLTGLLTSYSIAAEPGWDRTAAWMLGMSAGGYAAAALLDPNNQYTRGRATVVMTAGMLGVVAGGSVAAIATDLSAANNGPTIAMAATGAAAFGAAHLWTQDMNLSTNDGSNVVLATGLGALAGGCVGLIGAIRANYNDPISAGRLFVGVTTAGACTGFLLSLSSIKHRDESLGAIPLDINFNPANLGAAFWRKNTMAAVLPPPVVSVAYRW